MDKIKQDIIYITQDVSNLGGKGWSKTAIVSHLIASFGHDRNDASAAVDQYFINLNTAK